MPVVECEKHHLRYDSDRQSGCVRCRREAEAARGAVAPRTPTAAAETRRGGVLLPFLAAAFIWAISALGLITAHRAVLEQVAARTAAEESARNAAAAAAQAEAERRELQALQAQEPDPGALESVPAVESDSPPPQVAEPREAAEPAAAAEPEPPPEESSPPVSDGGDPPPAIRSPS